MDDILKYNKNKCEDYYTVLGCHQSSSTEQIICEYKTRALLLHPDKQQNSEHTEELFKKLVEAKDVLTDPESRKSYDKWLSSGIAIPFDKWTKMGNDVHISMHWINKSSRDLMLENGGQPSQGLDHSSSQKYFGSQSVKRFWNNDYDNEMIAKFRNYHI